jgi:hypothetical protein
LRLKFSGMKVLGFHGALPPRAAWVKPQ